MKTINKQGRHFGGERIAAMTVRQALRNLGVKEFPGNVGGWRNRLSSPPSADSYAIRLLGRFESGPGRALQCSNDAVIGPVHETAVEKPEAHVGMSHVGIQAVEHPSAISYIASCQPDRRLIYVSPQVSRLGFSAESLLDQPDLRLKQMHEDDFGRFDQALQRSCDAAERFSCHYRLYDSSGKVRWFHDEASVVCDESGAPRFIRGVMLDITDKKRMEAELADHRYSLERNVELRTTQLLKRIDLLESCNASLCSQLSAARLEIAALARQLRELSPAPEGEGAFSGPTENLLGAFQG